MQDVNSDGHPFQRSFDADQFETRLRALGARQTFEFPAGEIPETFRRSSVLICFWREADNIHVLLTKRATSLRGNPGQMSFPGGRLEAGEDAIQGALRETEEEVALGRDHVEVLGRLDDAWSGSRYHLVPIVGWLAKIPALTPSPDEVASIHTPTVHRLIEPGAFSREATDLDGDVFYNDTLHFDDNHAFGLTTDLLIEALRWGLGQELDADESHGASRLGSLRAWLRMQARQEAKA